MQHTSLSRQNSFFVCQTFRIGLDFAAEDSSTELLPNILSIFLNNSPNLKSCTIKIQQKTERSLSSLNEQVFAHELPLLVENVSSCFRENRLTKLRTLDIRIQVHEIKFARLEDTDERQVLNVIDLVRPIQNLLSWTSSELKHVCFAVGTKDIREWYDDESTHKMYEQMSLEELKCLKKSVDNFCMMNGRSLYLEMRVWFCFGFGVLDFRFLCGCV